MKYSAPLSLLLVVMALIGLTSCNTTSLDYTITGVSLSKVEFEPRYDDYAAYTADRDFYYMHVKVQPVHTKRTFAYSGRPYPNGCADRITAVNFETADRQNANAELGPMLLPDGRCERVYMGQPNMESVQVFHYDSAADIAEALQTGYDPRCMFLISTPKGNPQLASVNITMADRKVASVYCGKLRSYVEEIVYVDDKGIDRSLPTNGIPTAQLSGATAANVFAVSAAVERIYGDVCAHPNVHAQIFSHATEKYCTNGFKALLNKALTARPDDEMGPLDFDVWLMTQDEPKASYKVLDVTPVTELAAYKVRVTLLDDGEEYNTITLLMKQEGDAWKIDDFIIPGSGATVSIRAMLESYIKGE